MTWILAHVALLGITLVSRCQPSVIHPLQRYLSSKHATNLQPTLPPANGRLNLYMLPIGQGDAHLIQCPSGKLTFFDLGSSDDPPSRFWDSNEIGTFLGDSINDVHNIILTHNHWDHYSLMPSVFDEAYSLENIYMSCTLADVPGLVEDWINDIGARDLVRTFNGGGACGPFLFTPCEQLDLCPNDPDVTFQMMAANLGGHCSDGGNRNMDSLVLKITHNDVSFLYTGDFEDETSDWNEEGPQKLMVDFYGDDLAVTVYHVAHHGASFLANKPVWRDAIMPKAAFASSNPWYRHRHPRCVVFDAFINFVQSLCKPGVTDPESEFYCGDRVTGDIDVLQERYHCGGSGSTIEDRADNDFAIYTSVPDQGSINLVSMTSDGTKWQFGVQNLDGL